VRYSLTGAEICRYLEFLVWDIRALDEDSRYFRILGVVYVRGADDSRCRIF